MDQTSMQSYASKSTLRNLLLQPLNKHHHHQGTKQGRAAPESRTSTRHKTSTGSWFSSAWLCTVGCFSISDQRHPLQTGFLQRQNLKMYDKQWPLWTAQILHFWQPELPLGPQERDSSWRDGAQWGAVWGVCSKELPQNTSRGWEIASNIKHAGNVKLSVMRFLHGSQMSGICNVEDALHMQECT